MSDLTPLSDLPWQNCEQCRTDLPLIDLYWDKDHQEANGYRKVCKVCRKERRKKIKDLEIAQAVENYDRTALKLLDRAAKMCGSGNSLPHIAECFEQVMFMAGGAEGYAQHLWYTYLASQPGSMQRVKLLGLMAQFAFKTTESGAARKPLDTMTDEEIEQELQRRERQLPRLAHLEKTIDHVA